jgi:hypothetical protein
LLGRHAQLREPLLSVLGHTVTAGVRQPQQHLRRQITCLRFRDQWRNVFGLEPDCAICSCERAHTHANNAQSASRPTMVYLYTLSSFERRQMVHDSAKERTSIHFCTHHGGPLSLTACRPARNKQITAFAPGL